MDTQSAAIPDTDRLLTEREAAAYLRDRLASFDRRLFAFEIVVRGEDGRNGMKAQLTALCARFDSFEKRAIRWIAIGTSLPGIVVGVVAVLRFFGRV